MAFADGRRERALESNEILVHEVDAFLRDVHAAVEALHWCNVDRIPIDWCLENSIQFIFCAIFILCISYIEKNKLIINPCRCEYLLNGAGDLGANTVTGNQRHPASLSARQSSLRLFRDILHNL